jgi:hypothetical protein
MISLAHFPLPTAPPTDRQLVWWTLFLTAAIELLTCVLRFGAGLESTRDTASTIGVLTLGLRIHHSYIGLAITVAAFFFYRSRPLIGRYAMIVGLALLFSDLIHHFLVMYPITGSPHFHLWYPTK